MRIVIAPQEFKGSLTASEAAAAMAVGAREALPAASLELAPMSDGGPGAVGAGGAAVGRPVAAEGGTVAGAPAVIEMAAAAGLLRLAEDERDPRLASTYGVGELVRAALDAGCRRLIIGPGGRAPN